MDLYVVSYDLVEAGPQDYLGLSYAIKECGFAIPILATTWFVAAEGTTEAAIARFLKERIADKDELLVARVAANEATPEVTMYTLDESTHSNIQRIVAHWIN